MISQSRRSIIIAPIIILVVITFVALAFNFVSYSWTNWQPATCMPDRCFCEALRDGFIRQPINTYSNLAFVLAGLLIISIARDDWSHGAKLNLMQIHRGYPLIFGGAVIVIGLGSFFYHASLTSSGHWFDVMGMYVYASFALVYTYARLRPIRSTMFIFTYVVMNAMLGYLLVVNPDMRRQIFTAMVYGIIALELLVLLVERPKIKTLYFIFAMGVFALAYGIWLSDESGLICDPTSFLQGHAVWHLLGAVSALLLYLYYRSESGRV